MISAEQAKDLLAASKDEAGTIHLRYCETLSVRSEWHGLELFAKAPEMAATIIELEKRLKKVNHVTDSDHQRSGIDID